MCESVIAPRTDDTCGVCSTNAMFSATVGPADEVLCSCPVLHPVGRDQGHQLHHEAGLLLREGLAWVLGGSRWLLLVLLGLKLLHLLVQDCIVFCPAHVGLLKPLQVAPSFVRDPQVAVVWSDHMPWEHLSALVLGRACGIDGELAKLLPIHVLLHHVLIHGHVAEEPADAD